MHRFYLPPDQCAAATLRIEGAEARHARQVLRVRAGEQVTVLDGAGTSYLCEVREPGKHSVGLAVIEKTCAPPPPVRVHLYQAIPKGKTMEALIQKATELGVAQIVTVLTERAVPHLDEERGERKQEKWRQIAIEAIKQCGQVWLPQVSPPANWPAALERWSDCDLHIVASLQAGARRLREQLAEYQAQAGRKPGSVGLWIGPEGDFSPAEIAALLAHGARPITLGKLVLRVDTAVISALALLNDEFI
jgi:16S rRNA (uracil1498-N3)-methyltransferase